jgi:hypothetical protein
MGEEVGFVRMAEVKKHVEKIPEIGVGMLGNAFMGNAHTHVHINLPLFFIPRQ